MCWGCMSYANACNLLQKQLNFLSASPIEQLEFTKNNKPYDPNSTSIMNNIAGVENLLPINEWNKDKLSIYMYLANGFKGKIATYKAMKLIIQYEQWLTNETLEKQKEYAKLHEKNIAEWKRFDTWFIKHEIKEHKGLTDEAYKTMEESRLKELDELYNNYTNDYAKDYAIDYANGQNN